jgi:hypothetical protein
MYATSLDSIIKIQGWAVKATPVFNRPGQYSLNGQYYYFK